VGISTRALRPSGGQRQDDFLLVAAKMVVTEDAGEDFEGAGREIGHVRGTILGFVNGLLNDTEHTLALMKDLQVAETDDPESKAGKAGIALPVIGLIVGPKMLVSVQLNHQTRLIAVEIGNVAQQRFLAGKSDALLATPETRPQALFCFGRMTAQRTSQRFENRQVRIHCKFHLP
jgi:hypothetical protein